jgi:hypothetical protein
VRRRRRSPLPGPIEGEETDLSEIDVDVLSVGDRRLRRETVLAVPSSRGMPLIDPPLPEPLSALEVVAVDVQTDLDLVRHLAVALVESPIHFLGREAHRLELRDVLVAEVRPERRLFHGLVAGGGGQVDPPSRDHRRRPADSGDLGHPLDVLRLRPALGEIRVVRHRHRIRSPKPGPGPGGFVLRSQRRFFEAGDESGDHASDSPRAAMVQAKGCYHGDSNADA